MKRQGALTSGELATFRRNNIKCDAYVLTLHTSNALKIAHRHTIIDPIECASFTELIVTHNVSDEPAPYVIGTQIRHSPGDLSCYLIDLIVSTTGSWLFNATRTLEYASKENWTLIDEDKRDSRETLKTAADAYL